MGGNWIFLHLSFFSSLIIVIILKKIMDKTKRVSIILIILIINIGVHVKKQKRLFIIMKDFFKYLKFNLINEKNSL